MKCWLNVPSQQEKQRINIIKGMNLLRTIDVWQQSPDKVILNLNNPLKGIGMRNKRLWEFFFSSFSDSLFIASNSEGLDICKQAFDPCVPNN